MQCAAWSFSDSDRADGELELVLAKVILPWSAWAAGLF